MESELADQRPHVEEERFAGDLDALDRGALRPARCAAQPEDAEHHTGDAEELAEEPPAKEEEERSGEHHERAHASEPGIRALGGVVVVKDLPRPAHLSVTRR